ncbi:polyadenylate-binding protein-interacting protein 5-like [Momordica charantia]|uniref:Polyadenylate-binding protein-interacting protein 5-like n=1 Tax=Momordica charantia TaxID=3673 RepID=A0A6J1CJ15_MOMCH|nr:polyadenylate-binding protein-interacting protein 5-like [Momordica charantia]
MKPLGSSLNPYAASYIPLSKREADKNFIAENSSKKSIGGNFSGYSEHYMHNPPYDSISPNSNLRLGEKAPIAVGSAMKNHPSHGSLSQHKSEFNEMVEMFDKDFDLDLEFLKASFPGLSDQSLTDVYLANKGDVDAAIDMLSLLENKQPFGSEDYVPEGLPDSLDIGDISEYGFAADNQPSFKMKNVVGNASTSFRS